MDHAVLKVHTVPGKPDNLSDPHSREDRRQKQSLKGIAFQCREEALLLRSVQRRHLLFHHLRQNAGAGWIAFEILHPYSHVQGSMQDAMNVLDILGAALFCPELVIKLLHHGGTQLTERYISKRRFQMQPDNRFIMNACPLLYIRQVFLQPSVQPFANSHFFLFWFTGGVCDQPGAGSRRIDRLLLSRLKCV